MSDSPSDFVITGGDGQTQIGSNGRVAITLAPDGVSFMRKRIGLKAACSPQARRVEWLFAELDGVRCYVRDTGDVVHLFMTREDLYP